MSQTTTSGVSLEPKKQSKGDKLLAIVTRKKQKVKFEPKQLPRDFGQFSFIAADLDLGPRFKALGLTKIKLPDSIPMMVTIDIEGEGADTLRSNTYVCDAVRRVADETIDELFGKMADLLKTADPAAKSPNKRQYVNDTVVSQFKWLETTAAIDIVKRVEAYPAYLKAAEAAVKKWKVKCGASIALSSVVIVGGAVVTGLTWGATGPVAVVAGTRSCVQLAHTIADLAANIDQIGWMVQKQLSILQKSMESEDESTGGTVNKKLNSAKNAALGALSGLLGAKSLPTIKNCEGYIETYEIKRKQFDIELGKLGPQIKPLADGIEALKADLTKFTEKGQVATLNEFLKAADDQRKLLDAQVEKLDGASRRATKNRELWLKALEEIPVHGWTNQVSTVVGAVTDLGLATASMTDGPLMLGLSLMTSLSASIADQMIDKA